MLDSITQKFVDALNAQKEKFRLRAKNETNLSEFFQFNAEPALESAVDLSDSEFDFYDNMGREESVSLMNDIKNKIK